MNRKIGLGIGIAGVLGIVVPALAQQAVQWRVEDGGNGHWYGAAIYPEPGMNWVAARADVQARGADLVSLETADERTFATGVWAASTLFGAWIGLYQAADACEPGCGWRWVSGAPLADSDWAAGEPNNEGGSYGDEDHAMLAGLGWGGGPGRWVDWPGATILKTRAALVEWSADCNGDGIVDYGQIRTGDLIDADGNEVPDCCEAGTPCGDPSEVGPVVAWGMNHHGQSSVPPTLGLCRSVIGGDAHSYAIRADGAVAAWGVNNFGQSSVPAGLGPCRSLGGGVGSSAVIREDGTVFVWGMNTQGQANVPADLGPCMQVDGTYHCVALRYDRSVRAWGWNQNGQSNVPGTLGPCVFVAAGERHSMAIRIGGTIALWGANESGQLNPPSGLGACIAIDGGVGHTVVLRSDGSVAAWGRNADGECNVPAGLATCSAIAVGAWHSVALTTSGTVVAWGRNSEGQCNVPANLGRVAKVQAGGYHCLAIKEVCPADINQSGTIDAEDLAYVLFAWGMTGGKAGDADINGDATVDANDLSLVLGSWGSCP